MTAMTRLELSDDLMLPNNKGSAVAVVIRYFADRGVACTEAEARRIVRAE